uniref:Uncharacterized protein n=1 Tax=Glossina palpalis gambiensis TaxID=67801 RepID=A0A1B0AZ42_9MUSC
MAPIGCRKLRACCGISFSGGGGAGGTIIEGDECTVGFGFCLFLLSISKGGSRNSSGGISGLEGPTELCLLDTQPLSSLNEDVELLKTCGVMNCGGGARFGSDSLKPIVFCSLSSVAWIVVAFSLNGTLVEERIFCSAFAFFTFDGISLSELLESLRKLPFFNISFKSETRTRAISTDRGMFFADVPSKFLYFWRNSDILRIKSSASTLFLRLPATLPFVVNDGPLFGIESVNVALPTVCLLNAVGAMVRLACSTSPPTAKRGGRTPPILPPDLLLQENDTLV